MYVVLVGERQQREHVVAIELHDARVEVRDEAVENGGAGGVLVQADPSDDALGPTRAFQQHHPQHVARTRQHHAVQPAKSGMKREIRNAVSFLRKKFHFFFMKIKSKSRAHFAV